MFPPFVSHKNHPRRMNRIRTAKLVGLRHSFVGRSSRFEHLENRWMLADADIDLSFGTSGYAFVSVDNGLSFGAGSAIAIQSDGKIVAGGFSRAPDHSDTHAVIARFNPDGSLDSTFSNDGIYVDSFLSIHGPAFSNFNRLRDLAIDSQGKIVWSGEGGLVARVNPDGTPDTTFGFSGGGHFYGDQRFRGIHKLIIQPDDSILAAARGYGTGPLGDNGDYLILHLTQNGLPDASFGVSTAPIHGGAFGSGGYTQVDDDNGDVHVSDAVRTPDGKYVLVGRSINLLTGVNNSTIAQFNADGSLDATFGINGRRSLDLPGASISENASSIALNEDGKFVISIETNPTSFVIQLNSDGTFDTGFGGGDGVAEIGAGDFGKLSQLVIQSDGKIVLTGGSSQHATTWRLDPDGILDTSFDADGSVRHPFIANVDAANGVAIQADGKIVAVGYHFNHDGDPAPLGVLGVIRLGTGVTLSGRVFDDLDNDGLFELGDVGLEGVTVNLTGTDAHGAVARLTTSGTDGTYSFDQVFAGTYTLTAEQPAGLLDGKEAAGTLGGDVDNSLDSNTITEIVVGNDGAAATGYDFAEIRPSDLLGLVWEDSNNDGQVNFGEKAIANVAIALTGVDDRGNAVNLATHTDLDGVYLSYDLRPGTYTVSETQPAGYNDGLDIVGSLGGTNSANDVISGIVIALPGSVGENYNFGERPIAGAGTSAGQTATIGFWQNNNGQALIETLNGGGSSTQLASWLAATFDNMYGASAGANDLTGMTNVEVADFYSDLFRRTKKEAEQLGLGGPVKVDAQVMAVALATYVTNLSLAGATAQSFGFLVTEHGVGTTTFNVGNSGEAFGVADNSLLAVLDLLFATDDNSQNGVLYDIDGDGDADDNWETTLRTLANDVYSAINEAGEI
jgi:uncharacterized delta-60 repeat protein